MSGTCGNINSFALKPVEKAQALPCLCSRDYQPGVFGPAFFAYWYDSARYRGRHWGFFTDLISTVNPDLKIPDRAWYRNKTRMLSF